ncbi:MAG: hypothetical protein ACT4O0_07330 [Pseudonocardia sp.]|jgi:hypothetical protein
MSPGCAGHDGLADELRDYATGALDLLQPWLAQLRDRPADPTAPEPASCAVCPLCALITVLRGGRSELAVKAVEQVGGLLAVLRVALEEGARAAAPAPTPDGATPASATPASATPASATPASAAPDAGRASRGGDGAVLPDGSRGVQRIPVAREEDAPSHPC